VPMQRPSERRVFRSARVKLATEVRMQHDRKRRRFPLPC
jgi:hypothetical protein